MVVVVVLGFGWVGLLVVMGCATVGNGVSGWGDGGGVCWGGGVCEEEEFDDEK